MVVPVPEIPHGRPGPRRGSPRCSTACATTATRARSRYTCDDFRETEDSDADADTDADSDTDADTVDVEAEYIVGEYDVKILSAEESTGLVTWLQTNGYQVPDASADLLGEYLDGGAYFFAAQVRPDAGIQSGDTLSPLQFSYDSDVFGLPIRIGTLNSPGQQDLRIYAITDYDQGSVGISNYSEAPVDHDCMWQPGRRVAGSSTTTASSTTRSATAPARMGDRVQLGQRQLRPRHRRYLRATTTSSRSGTNPTTTTRCTTGSRGSTCGTPRSRPRRT